MGVMDQNTMLVAVSFRKGEPRLGWEDWTVYPGPDINSLPLEVTSALDHVMREAGLDVDLLLNMVINASSYC